MAASAPAPHSAPEKYRPLPGRTWIPLHVARLWLASDHLLATRTTFGVERYRRFYFKDVEALVVQRTKHRAIWNAVFGGIGGAICGGGIAFIALIQLTSRGKAPFNFSWKLDRSSVSGGISFPNLDPVTKVFAVIAAFFLLLMLINTLRGQTCALYIQTSSGLTRLDAAVRTRIARRLIARLAPEIEAAQMGRTNGA